jgi:twitching motility protein PilT
VAQIDKLLIYVREQEGSDLHLYSDSEPKMRLNGQIQTIPGWPKLSTKVLQDAFREITPPPRWKQFADSKDTDFAYGLPGVGRFRVNLAVNEAGLAGVMRLIPDKIATISELGLPGSLNRFAELDGGLVMVCGPTGSGKSTTLAAILNEVNRKRQVHIITIEDPLEFVHENQTAIVTHREVGTHGKDFASLLRLTLHSDADVVLVGELRDAETIGLALEAAETGILVFSTVHANTTASALDRLAAVFPAEQQYLARSVMAETVAGVVAQALVPAVGGKGRVAATEVLFRSESLPMIIRDGQMSRVYSITGADAVATMDNELIAFARAGRIDPVDARMWVRDRIEFDKAFGT